MNMWINEKIRFMNRLVSDRRRPWIRCQRFCVENRRTSTVVIVICRLKLMFECERIGLSNKLWLSFHPGNLQIDTELYIYLDKKENIFSLFSVYIGIQVLIFYLTSLFSALCNVNIFPKGIPLLLWAYLLFTELVFFYCSSSNSKNETYFLQRPSSSMILWADLIPGGIGLLA